MKIDKNVIDYWDNRYSKGRGSGVGSVGQELGFKLDIIGKFSDKKIDSILDIGCGDMSLGSSLFNMFPNANYIGLDVSKSVIKRANDKFASEKRTFSIVSDYSLILKADLVICMDVLFHQLNDNEYFGLIKFLRNCYNKYLFISEYPDGIKEKNLDKMIKYRKFDPELLGDNFECIRIPTRSNEKFLYVFEKQLC